MRDRVLVVGSITADLTSFASRHPRSGETLLGTGFTLVLGGKGANQALAARRAGAPTAMVGCVGDDLFQDVVLDGLRAEDVDTAQVVVVPGPTGVAHIRVDGNGENDIVMVPLANAALAPAQVEAAVRAASATARVLLLQLEIPLDAALHAARIARSLDMTVVLDPAPAATLPDEAWALADVVTPNESEATLLTGVSVTDADSARAAGEWFVARGTGRAVITLGGQGAVVVDRHGATVHAPFPATPLDTTAAGDAFAGALGASLANGLAWEESLRRAMAAGALAVGVRGASPSLPTAAQVDELLASHPRQESHRAS